MGRLETRENILADPENNKEILGKRGGQENGKKIYKPADR